MRRTWYTDFGNDHRGWFSVKIGIFADAHYSSKNISNLTRRPILSLGKLRQAMDAFRDVDCIVCLGDLVDTCDTFQESEEKLREVGELMQSVGVPLYCLRGNHDCDIFTSEQFYERLGVQKPPFSIRNGSNVLIFLDANSDHSGQAYIPGRVDWTDTRLPEDQLAQLSEILNAEDVENAYIFMHQNVDPQVQWQHILTNAGAIRKVISNSGKVRKVIQGHYHPRHDAVIDGVLYHTLPAMCEGERNYYEIMEI